MSTSTHDVPVENSTREEVAEAAKAWRQVELAGFDLMSPKWWDATRRLRDVIDRLPSMTYDGPTGEHGADSLTGGV